MIKKRYVVYSAMVGAYDDILQPQVIDERFDYVLFTNDTNETTLGVWQVRHVDYYNSDKTRIARYVKTHPEELLPEYEVSVWMDSNIQIQTNYIYQKVLDLDRRDVLISAMWHPERQCTYSEAFAVLYAKIEHESIITDWCHKLHAEKFPRNYGLCETGILYRKHVNEQIKNIDAMWWQCIADFSRRDQLSFNYVLWKNNLRYEFFFGEGVDVRNVEYVSLIEHKDEYHNTSLVGKNEAWLIRHCSKHNEDKERIENLYYRLCAYPFPRLWVALAGQYYRICDRLKDHK